MKSSCRFVARWVILPLFAGIVTTVVAQHQFTSGSSGGSQQSQATEECGVQDTNEDFDFHVAAPWAAALFALEGDIFESNIKFVYLSTATIVSKNLVLTSSTSKLYKFGSRLTLIYGHRGSPQQKLIRIRKAESLVLPAQPLQLKIDTSYPLRSTTSQKTSGSKDTANSTEPAVYLLHLESPIEITAFSKPVCLSADSFQYMSQYFRATGTKRKHLSGYAARNDTGKSQHGVSYSPDSDWKVKEWNGDTITVVPTGTRLTYDMLPHNFNPGSALTLKINQHFFLVGILMKTSGTETIFRSMENFVDLISLRQQEFAGDAAVQTNPQFSQSSATKLGNIQSNPSSDQNSQGQDAFLAEIEKKEETRVNRPTSPPTVSRSSSTGISSSTVGSALQYSDDSSPTCSQQYTAGVDIECISRPHGVSGEDCIKKAPANSIIRLSCKKYYVPVYSDSVEKKCDSSGQWLPREPFDCKLDCGTIKQQVPYVVHGVATESQNWPWHAALYKLVNQTTYAYICGATLISRNVLITAAHCVQDGGTRMVNSGLFRVVVGAVSSDLEVNHKDPQAQEFSIRDIRVNDHYSQRNYEGDIAIMQLDKSVRLTDYVRPVCWPAPGNFNKALSNLLLSEGNVGVVVGFGTTHENWNIAKTLRMANLPYVSVKNCTAVLERIPSSTQYCAGYTNGTSVCEGDSGGSQVFKDPSSQRYYIQGIISHGNRKDFSHRKSQCDNEKYTVFTRVEAFSDWIQRIIHKVDSDYTR